MIRSNALYIIFILLPSKYTSPEAKKNSRYVEFVKKKCIVYILMHTAQGPRKVFKVEATTNDVFRKCLKKKTFI